MLDEFRNNITALNKFFKIQKELNFRGYDVNFIIVRDDLELVQDGYATINIIGRNKESGERLTWAIGFSCEIIEGTNVKELTDMITSCDRLETMRRTDDS
jgi:hypothetical protein